MEKITLPLINYKNYTVLEGEHEYINLHDQYLEAFGQWKYLWTGDDDLVPKEKLNDYNYIMFKNTIVSIDRCYAHADECYKVIVVNMANEKLDFIMKGRTAASALQEKLLNWKLSKTSLE